MTNKSKAVAFAAFVAAVGSSTVQSETLFESLWSEYVLDLSESGELTINSNLLSALERESTAKTTIAVVGDMTAEKCYK